MIRGRLPADCSRHHAALTAWAAHPETTASDGAVLGALDHVEWCRRCADELQSLALAVVALRRLADGADPTSGGAVAWSRLRVRIERSRVAAAAMAWRWRTTLAGLAAGTLVVAAVVGPLALHLPINSAGAEPVGYSTAELEALDRRIEESFTLTRQVGTLPAIDLTSGSSTAIPKRYPDGLAPVGKEVAARPTGRPLSVD